VRLVCGGKHNNWPRVGSEVLGGETGFFKPGATVRLSSTSHHKRFALGEEFMSGIRRRLVGTEASGNRRSRGALLRAALMATESPRFPFLGVRRWERSANSKSSDSTDGWAANIGNALTA
jgi:hypothetical protein